MKELFNVIKGKKFALISIAIIIFLVVFMFKKFGELSTDNIRLQEENQKLTQSTSPSEMYLEENSELSSAISDNNNIDESNVGGDDTEKQSKLNIELLISDYIENSYSYEENYSEKQKQTKFKVMTTDEYYKKMSEELSSMFYIREGDTQIVTDKSVYFGKIYSTNASAIAVIKVKTIDSNNEFVENTLYERYSLKYDGTKWLIDDVSV